MPKKIKRKKGAAGAPPPQEVRMVDTIDYTKADKNCQRCKGTGISGFVQPNEDLRKAGVDYEVPVTCACVTAGGGVPDGPLAKFAEQLKAQIADGTWVRDQIKDMKKLSQVQRDYLLRTFDREARNPKLDTPSRQALRQVVEAFRGATN